MNKTARVLLLLSASVACIALAYYLVIYTPKARQKSELNQARMKATTECEEKRVHATKLQTEAIEYNNKIMQAGQPNQIDDKMINDYNSIFTPEWFQGCVSNTLTIWGY
jgi:uncharacterized protein YlxW (UPF0749 family)